MAFVRKPDDYIHNQQLTSTFEPVTVPQNFRFNTYIMGTKDNSPLEIKFDNSAPGSFLFTSNFDPALYNTQFSKNESDTNNILFYAKGTGVLQIMFIKE